MYKLDRFKINAQNTFEENIGKSSTENCKQGKIKHST